MKNFVSATKKLLGCLLVVCFLMSLHVGILSATAVYEDWVMIVQNDTKWTGAANTYGTGTLRATGCGIFSLVNAVGYLTGNAMDVNEVAAWAYSIGAYNKGGADGTYRLELYPKVTAKYGARYGFSLDCNGTSGWWSTVNNSVLKNHLANGGTAIAHVPNHFIALVDYNASSDSFHVLDSYPTNGRNDYPGDVWRTTYQLTSANSYMTVDWWCLLSEDGIQTPVVTAPTTVEHGATLTASWAAVNKATSYSYKAEVYQGEMSATTATTVASGTTTGTSFTVPAQSSGKYMKISVTATDGSNSKTGTATVMMGPWVGSYPTTVEYIPVADVNGTQSASNSTIWNSSKGTTFGMTWWRAFLCSPNADGTYTVNTIYENGAEKSVSVTGKNVLWAIHSAYANYEYCTDIVVGDKLTFKGVYIDKATVRGSGYVLVNGGVPIGPTSLTIKAGNDMKFDAEYLDDVSAGVTGDQLKAMFNEESQYISIKNTAGAAVTTGAVGTGCTVSLIVNNVTVSTYTVIVPGDLNGDASITSADLMTVGLSVTGAVKVDAVGTKAADMDGSGEVGATDYLAIKTKI
ncbi:MAG: dockerin type I repeat-containing protein [Clostridia bacterium]|nr:dockerin type I repeat-containing protein [Clostridia bacterium]